MAEDNPWGKKKPPQNIDDLVDEGLKKIQSIFAKGGGGSPPNGSGQPSPTPIPRGSNKGMWLLLLAALIVYSGWKSFYVIQPGEQGVVLRLGKYDRTGGAGLNLIIPFMEKVFILDVESVRTIEFGFRGPSERDVQRSLISNSRTYDTQSLMLTGDRNVINLNWVVQYRIKNPTDFLFRNESPTSLIKDSSEFVLRRLVGNRDFDYVLDRREEVAFETQREMQLLLSKDQYKTGIEIVKVQLLDVTPPETVRPSFNEVNEADQDKTRLVNEAQKTLNERIPKARGEAQKLIQEAEGYAVQRLNRAEGETARFNSIYGEYKDFRSVTRTRLYLETMRKVLPSVEEVVVMDSKSNVLPLLNLSNKTTGNAN